MTLTHDEMKAAEQEALKVAKGLGRPVAIVEYDRRGLLLGRNRSWRIEPNPTSDHRVIVSDVRPRFPTAEMIEATVAARTELPEAMEALRFLINRCIKAPSGTPRTQEDVEAMLIDLAAALVAQECQPEALGFTAVRRDLPGYQEPRA